MTAPRSLLVLVACTLAASVACGPSDADLRRAVLTYTDRVIEAYRTSDPRPIEPVTGEEEGRRITALIGVKRDMGITLDARLLELRFGEIERRGDELLVETEERWHYEDRRIGSGVRVGQDSTDRYWLRYRLRKRGGALRVEAVDFARAPEIGRKEAPAATWDSLHGVDTHAPTEPPSGAGGKAVVPGVILRPEVRR